MTPLPETETLRSDPAFASPAGRLVGFAGLGTMGLPMALNLAKSGFPVLGHVRRSPSGNDGPVQAGFSMTSEPGDFRKVRELVLMLPNADALADLLFGPRGIAPFLERGTVVINTSTVSPEQSQTFDTQLAACGLRYLEAPVTGSKTQAETRTLSFLVGGPEHLMKQATPLFLAMGSRVQWLGKTGTASAAKLAANLIGAVNLLAWCEGMHLAERHGVCRPDFLQVVMRSGAKSAVAEAKGPNTVTRDYPPAFRLGLMAKDLRLAARCAGSASPLIAAALETYASAVEKLGPNQDVSAVNEIYE